MVLTGAGTALLLVACSRPVLREDVSWDPAALPEVNSGNGPPG
jgi:hypothetical protein